MDDATIKALKKLIRRVPTVVDMLRSGGLPDVIPGAPLPHRWFKRFVEDLRPGDIIRLSPTSTRIDWRVERKKKVSAKDHVGGFHSPYDDKHDKEVNARWNLDRLRFYLENFLGYTLTLRGLRLSPVRVFDAEGKRLKVIERYGSTMAVFGLPEFKDYAAFWEEGKRVHRAEYRVTKIRKRTAKK
jgi:hypothetical protein